MSVLAINKPLCINGKALDVHNVSPTPTPVPGDFRILYEDTGVELHHEWYDYRWRITCDAIAPSFDIYYREAYPLEDPWIALTLEEKQALLSTGLYKSIQAIRIENVSNTLTRFELIKDGGDPTLEYPIFPRLTITNTALHETWAAGQATDEYYIWCRTVATQGNVTFEGL